MREAFTLRRHRSWFTPVTVPTRPQLSSVFRGDMTFYRLPRGPENSDIVRVPETDYHVWYKVDRHDEIGECRKYRSFHIDGCRLVLGAEVGRYGFPRKRNLTERPLDLLPETSCDDDAVSRHLSAIEIRCIFFFHLQEMERPLRSAIPRGEILNFVLGGRDGRTRIAGHRHRRWIGPRRRRGARVGDSRGQSRGIGHQ